MARRRAPWREYRFRILSIAVGVVVGILVVTVLLPLVTGQRLVLGWGLPVGVLVVVLIAVGGGLLGLRLGDRLVGDRIEGALREPGGRWRHGRVTIDGDTVTFERYRFQMRIPSGKKQRFDNVRLGADSGQRPPLRTMWSINPQVHIVSLDADQGHFEFAALPSRIEELHERVAAPQTW